MEQLQVHSRSYIVRWIQVHAGESISWSLQPHKKSLNFGIFKHPGGKAGASPNLPTSDTLDPPPTPSDNEFSKVRRNSTAKEKEKDPATAVVEKLQSIGLKCVAWNGKCEADQVSMGRFDVHEGDGGMYGLVFDNTFSKAIAKTATFVLMTHPSSAPPKSGAQLKYTTHATGSSTSVGKSPSLRPTTASTDSLPHDIPSSGMPTLKIPRRGSALSLSNTFYTGVMHKKRRKKNQGYARRFFSLDFTSSTLSYYRNSHASALRGSVPLALAAIGVDEKRKEFSIDSGAEVWHLRLKNQKDFESWRQALERATSSPVAASPSPIIAKRDPGSARDALVVDPLDERDWLRVEELVARVSGSRDAVRRLAQDTDPKYTPSGNGHSNHSSAGSPTEPSTSFFPDMSDREPQKLPFWKRKTSSSGQTPTTASLLRRSFSAQGSATSTAPLAQPTSPMVVPKIRTPTYPPSSGHEDIHERCMALLRDLDNTVTEFSSLLADNKARRRPAVSKSASRMSMESSRSDDFFDAEESVDAAYQMISIRHSDEVTDERDDFFSDEESITSSDAGERGGSALAASPTSEAMTLFPRVGKDLLPSSVPFVQGRPTVSPPRQPPPSIIGFLRKNAGKDLSTVAMPVTANEPTSLLQRLAEPFESADLLSQAAQASHPTDRLVKVAAFAIASLASNRVKERAVRKPFNPMLGETYELVRNEGADQAKPAYRFVAEKVTHHPVRMAWQADSVDGTWSVAQSPRPVQKFWGKSVELNTDGKYRLTLRSATSQANGIKPTANPSCNEEHYSWTQPTAYLRNVIAGEKYVEPTGSMTVLNESTGAKAVATFKASGLFAGRSEDVTVHFYDPSSSHPLDITLAGKWTTTLSRSDTGAEVWRAGPVVPDANKAWGFSTFAARLNEVTDAEDGKLPPTDSRLRPDQRALEEGQLDKAEGIKARLEERQRARRKVLESHGRPYNARFFEVVEGPGDEEEGEVYRLRTGKAGYWECRERGEWSDVVEVFEA